MCKTSKMCKNSIWDLINSTINKRDERDKRDVSKGSEYLCKCDIAVFFLFTFFFTDIYKNLFSLCHYKVRSVD